MLRRMACQILLSCRFEISKSALDIDHGLGELLHPRKIDAIDRFLDSHH